MTHTTCQASKHVARWSWHLVHCYRPMSVNGLGISCLNAKALSYPAQPTVSYTHGLSHTVTRNGSVRHTRSYTPRPRHTLSPDTQSHTLSQVSHTRGTHSLCSVQLCVMSNGHVSVSVRYAVEPPSLPTHPCRRRVPCEPNAPWLSGFEASSNRSYMVLSPVDVSSEYTHLKSGLLSKRPLQPTGTYMVNSLCTSRSRTWVITCVCQHYSGQLTLPCHLACETLAGSWCTPSLPRCRMVLSPAYQRGYELP